MFAVDCPRHSRAPPPLPRAACAPGGSWGPGAVLVDLLYRRRDSAGNRGASGAYMAHPLARTSALDLLEDAVNALRAAPLATIVSHGIGSVPFALGLLVFWNDMAEARTSDGRPVVPGQDPARRIENLEETIVLEIGDVDRFVQRGDRVPPIRRDLRQETDGVVPGWLFGEGIPRHHVLVADRGFGFHGHDGIGALVVFRTVDIRSEE